MTRDVVKLPADADDRQVRLGAQLRRESMPLALPMKNPTVLRLSSKLRHASGSAGKPPCFANPQPTGQPWSAVEKGQAPLEMCR